MTLMSHSDCSIREYLYDSRNGLVSYLGHVYKFMVEIAGWQYSRDLSSTTPRTGMPGSYTHQYLTLTSKVDNKLK